MADQVALLAETIRASSAEVEPITLAELENRPALADHSAYRADLVLIDSSDLAPTAAEPAVETRSWRPRWLALAAAVFVGALLTIGLILSGGDQAQRISSTKPGDTTNTAPDSTTTTTTSRQPVEDEESGSSLDDVFQPGVGLSLLTDMNVTALVQLDDGRLVVGSHGNSLQIWDLARLDDGAASVELELPFDPSQEFGPADRVVTGLAQLSPGAVVVTSVFDGVLAVDEYELETGGGLRGGINRDATAPVVPALLLDDERIASAAGDGNVILDWVGNESLLVETQHASTVLAIGQLADGRIVTGDAEGDVRLWNPETGLDDPSTRPFDEHSAAVNAIAVLPDGRIASGSADGIILVWHPDEAPREVVEFDRHAEAVTALAALPDGRLVSGAADGSVMVWHPDQAVALAETVPGHADSISVIAVLDNNLVATGSADTTVQVWRHTPLIGTPPQDDATGARGGDSGQSSVNDTSVVPLIPSEIPVASADRLPIVVECEGGGPGLPPNEGGSDLTPDSEPSSSPEEALLHFLESGGIGDLQSGQTLEFVQVDVGDGLTHYVLPFDNVLPLSNRSLDEILLLITVAPSADATGFHVSSWEQTGC